MYLIIKAGAVGTFSGSITDKESKYLANMAFDNACNFYQFMANVSIVSAYFADNLALHIALITISTNCQFFLLNTVIKNLTTIGGGINLANSIDSIIQNLSFVNYNSQMGPAISMVSLSTKLMLNNISFLIISTSDQNLYPGKLLGVWDSQALISRLTTSNVIGQGLFDIQFNSQITFEILEITNNTCNFIAKGCLFFIDSNSSVFISDIKISNVTTFNSIIFVQNSQFAVSGLILKIALMDKSSVDKYFLILDSSNVTFLNFELIYLSSKFMVATASVVTFQSGNAGNMEAYKYIPDQYFAFQQGVALFYFYQSFNVEFINVTFHGFGYFVAGVF